MRFLIGLCVVVCATHLQADEVQLGLTGKGLHIKAGRKAACSLILRDSTTESGLAFMMSDAWPTAA